MQRLLEDLRQSRFVAVIGQSGVGKSSLVQAGLLPTPAVRCAAAAARPGGSSSPGRVAQPTTSLASTIVALQPGPAMQDTVDRLDSDERTLDLAATLALADEPAGSKLLVVVDQFEEIFTLCTDPDERSAFVRNVVYAATIPHGRMVVVVTMRADFYPQLAAVPGVRPARPVAPDARCPGWASDELREVIQEPAYRAGLQVEQGLADTILGDVERKPGNLPLLQHALLETWQNRRGTMLTLEGYRATGGVQHGARRTRGGRVRGPVGRGQGRRRRTCSCG